MAGPPIFFSFRRMPSGALCVTNHLKCDNWMGWLGALQTDVASTMCPQMHSTKGGTREGMRFLAMSILLTKRPAVVLNEDMLTKSCRRCGTIFATKSRIRKLCDPCRAVAAGEKQRRSNARLKARRAASRAAHSTG